MNEYIKTRGREIAIDFLNQIYKDIEKPDIMIEVQYVRGGLGYGQIIRQCEYYDNLWRSFNSYTDVVVERTLCVSYGDFYVFFTKIRRDLV